MSRRRDLGRFVGTAASLLAGAAAALLLGAAAVHAQPVTYPGLGRAATAQELAAWDIDVRPDFKGLPKGAGSVAKGMVVWEGKCASCHGVFGESNQVFAPIVGGTTKDDVKNGRVARLDDAAYPGRTTLMKLATVSTLWDYINRAMPWANPKSLSTEEVYGVTAYILNLGGVVADDFTLSDRNIADVQALLPNRHGTTRAHALWPGAAASARAPDVRASACMKDCPVVAVASSFPDSARNSHGNLAQQNRAVGAQRGIDTTTAAPGGTAGVTAAAKANAAASAETSVTARADAVPAAPGGSPHPALALAQKNSCTACHGIDAKIVGPGLREIGARYKGRADAVTYLAGKIKAGGSGVWGAVAMPPQTLSDVDAATIAQWLAGGAGR
jgi:S-disulfanyl-L-cysteine oxidoreductase SoxD